MNRLSFLKTIGVGIATAVITPKLLIESAVKEEVNTVGIMPYTQSLSKDSIYGHYEENFPHLTVEQLYLNDLCIDRERRMWLCTAMGFGMIELTALLAEPEPNFIEIKRNNFDDYFIIMGICFKATDA